MYVVRTLIAGLVLSALPDLALAYRATVVAELNIRSGPCTCAPVIGRLRAGDGVDVWAVRAPWVRISVNGWVRQTYLDVGGRDYAIYRPEDYSLRPGSAYAAYGAGYRGTYGYAGYTAAAYPYPPVWRPGRRYDLWYGRPYARPYGVRARVRW
jgi:uncharacterized protein YraI